MIRATPLLLTCALLAACAAPPPAPMGSDPHEAANRAQFEANLRLVSRFQSAEEPDQATSEPPRANPLRRAVSNIGENLGTPRRVVNDLLQLRPDHAFENTLRFAINSTVGLGGLFDPAGALGLHGRNTDFGETLHRWGVGEGDYLVLPLLGPSTERDALGRVVDLALDPLRYALTPDEQIAATVLRGAGYLAQVAEASDLLDANVIDTADPYAQARLLYLQTRRYHLGIEDAEEFIDPYADF